MGRATRFSGLMGMIKDKASQSKAALVAKPKLLAFQLALLRATSHDPSTPPSDKHLATLLSFGKTSRATASAAIEVLMDRLQSTQNCAVALKCLIAVHHIVKNGAFILQDQLSVFPFTGGRNYLKLSDFRDDSSPMTWELSSWVRWYAQYIETILSISRILGFFIGSSTSIEERQKKSDQISAILNSDVLRETESLVGLIEETTKKPHFLHLNGNRLVEKIHSFVVDDYMSATEEISVRVTEFHERLSCLGFGESVELVCALKRLEDCKEKQLLRISAKDETSMDRFWDLIRKTKNMVGGAGESKHNHNRESGRLTKATSRSRTSKSGRFTEPAFVYSDSLRFGSARFDVSYKRIPAVGLTQSYLL